MNTPRAMKPLLCGLLVALSGGLMSCQDRDFGISIRQVQPFDINGCTISTDPTSFRSRGSADIALLNSYTIYPYIENNMLSVNEVKQFDQTEARVNTTDVILRSATIEYTTLDTLSTQLESPTIVPLSGTVKVGSSLVIGLEVLNSAVLSQLRDADEFLIIEDNGSVRPVRSSISIIARVRVAGETLDGKEVESNEFLFPIEICNGCSVFFPGNLLESRNGELVCPAVKVDGEGSPIVGPSAEASCTRFGADGRSIDCQTCQGFAVNPFSRQLCQPPVID